MEEQIQIAFQTVYSRGEKHYEEQKASNVQKLEQKFPSCREGKDDARIKKEWKKIRNQAASEASRARSAFLEEHFEGLMREQAKNIFRAVNDALRAQQLYLQKREDKSEPKEPELCSNVVESASDVRPEEHIEVVECRMKSNNRGELELMLPICSSFETGNIEDEGMLLDTLFR